MSQILIDYELLRRILKSHLDLTVEARAFRQQRQQFWATLDPTAPEGTERLDRFVAEHERFAMAQREQIRGRYVAIERDLDSGDENRVLFELRRLFPPE